MTPMIPLFRLRTLAVAGAALLSLTTSYGQAARPTGKINERYAELCANCHGKKLEGGQTPSGAKVPSLLDNEWLHGGDDESIAKSIRLGYPEKEMPPWGEAIGEKDVRAMVIYIREQQDLHRRGQLELVKPPVSFSRATKLHGFQLDTWVDDVKEPYSLAFLSPTKALMTEKKGHLFLIENGKIAPRPVLGLPAVDTASQAGLYDVVPHPQYEKNGWIYFAYSDPQGSTSMTRIIRAKLRDNTLIEQETIYQAQPEHYIKTGGVHFGGRIAFDKQGYLYFVIGERGQRDQAQDLGRPTGKVHRLHDDGRVPADNPFVKNPKALPSVWSYGHRNPQGLSFHPVTGQLFDLEHGPRGGDELNLVQKGKNYGWPVITYGMEYNGTATTELTHKEGMEQPLKYWVPSIAPCGSNFYTGDSFPKWKNHLFVASLAGQQLVRIEIADSKVVDSEVIFSDVGRIRHVIGGPDGALYVLLPTRIAKVTPKG